MMKYEKPIMHISLFDIESIRAEQNVLAGPSSQFTRNSNVNMAITRAAERNANINYALTVIQFNVE